MRILYAATGEIAVPLLRALAQRGDIAAVLTAPDAPGKRGKTLIPSPVKVAALELGLDVWQPETLRKEARAHVRSLMPDALMSFCYGKIFGPMFLSLFRYTFNVHPSLLPKYRGCAPLYAAIRNLDRESGITLQEIAPGIDEGRIYRTVSFALDGTEDIPKAESIAAELAPSLVLPVLDDLDNIELSEQTGEPSYTEMVKKEDGRIDFSRPAAEVHALIRASYPWPKAYCMLDGSPLYITGVYGSAFDTLEPGSEAPGTVVGIVKGKGLKIAAGDGYIYASRVLPPMKKEMDALAFANGCRGICGRVLQ